MNITDSTDTLTPGVGAEDSKSTADAADKLTPDTAAQTDAADKLTARLPEAHREIAHQLSRVAGIDLVTASIVGIVTATNWASRVEVRTPDGIQLPCQVSLLVGVPNGCDLEQLAHGIFDPLESSALEEHRFLYTDLRKGERGARVGALLRNPDSAALKFALTRNETGRLFVALTGEPWFERIMRTQHSAETSRFRSLLEMGASACVRLNDPHKPGWEKNALKQFHVNFVGIIGVQSLRRAIRNDDYSVRISLSHALRLNAETMSVRPEPAGMQGSWNMLLQAATQARVRERVSFSVEPAAASLFDSWQKRIMAELHVVGGDAWLYRVFLNLPIKLYGGLRFAGHEDPLDLAELAVELATLAHTRMTALHSDIAAEKVTNARDADAKRLLEKITARGPITMRNLMRTESHQRRHIHHPAIFHLMKAGLIKRDEFGRFVAVSK